MGRIGIDSLFHPISTQLESTVDLESLFHSLLRVTGTLIYITRPLSIQYCAHVSFIELLTMQMYEYTLSPLPTHTLSLPSLISDLTHEHFPLSLTTITFRVASYPSRCSFPCATASISHHSHSHVSPYHRIVPTRHTQTNYVG